MKYFGRGGRQSIAWALCIVYSFRSIISYQYYLHLPYKPYRIHPSIPPYLSVVYLNNIIRKSSLTHALNSLYTYTLFDSSYNTIIYNHTRFSFSSSVFRFAPFPLSAPPSLQFLPSTDHSLRPPSPVPHFPKSPTPQPSPPSNSSHY